MPDLEPKVKTTPDFKTSETVIHIGERTEHKITAIHKDGTFTLQGLAGHIRADAVEKK